jgi:hypothetical protein
MEQDLPHFIQSAGHCRRGIIRTQFGGGRGRGAEGAFAHHCAPSEIYWQNPGKSRQVGNGMRS